MLPLNSIHMHEFSYSPPLRVWLDPYPYGYYNWYYMDLGEPFLKRFSRPLCK